MLVRVVFFKTLESQNSSFADEKLLRLRKFKVAILQRIRKNELIFSSYLDNVQY